MTNAHVLAGVSDPVVHAGDEEYDATPVFVDQEVDIAVLAVPGLPEQALPFAQEPAGTGADAIIIETQTGLEELGLGIEAAREAGAACVIGSLAYDVTLDGSTKTSLANGGLPAGVTAAEACSLGGARYDKQSGTYSGSVTINP